MEELASLATHKFPACVKYREQFRKIDKDVPPEVLEEFSRNYRVLPLLEGQIFDFVHSRHSSLNTNKLLGCRWREFKKIWEQRVPGPFQFPELKDFHFYDYFIKYAPWLSVDRLPNYLHTLKPGPGVDNVGELPIPGDRLHTYRSMKTVRKDQIKPRIEPKIQPVKKGGRSVQKRR